MKRSKCNLLCCVIIAVGILSILATKTYSIMYTNGVYGAFSPADPTWHITFALVCDALVCSIPACYMLMSHAGKISFDDTFACKNSISKYSMLTAICTIIMTALEFVYMQL